MCNFRATFFSSSTLFSGTVKLPVFDVAVCRVLCQFESLFEGERDVERPSALS